MKNLLNNKRKLFLLIFVFSLLLVVAFATEPGSEEDPLISLSYFENKIEQLKTEITERSEGLIALTEGVLYPPLYRMIQKGYISERKETVCKRRVRVYYHLEELGKEYLSLLCEEYKKSYTGVSKVMKWGDANG